MNQSEDSKVLTTLQMKTKREEEEVPKNMIILHNESIYQKRRRKHVASFFTMNQ